MSFYVSKYYRKGEFAKTEAVSRVLRTLQEESDVILNTDAKKGCGGTRRTTPWKSTMNQINPQERILSAQPVSHVVKKSVLTSTITKKKKNLCRKNLIYYQVM